MQSQLPSYTYTFDPNNYCFSPDGKWGNCLECPLKRTGGLEEKNKCAPCNSCPRREGYWTPSKTEEGKLVEVKCHEPCSLFGRWQSITKYKICLLKHAEYSRREKKDD
jgi:hypothetical protein